MSNHKDSLVKVLEYLVNEEREKAADLLHTVFVEKAKNHWSALTENDESVEEDIQEEDLDETYDFDDEEVEEAIDNYDAEDDFLNDIENAEDEIEFEEIYDNEDMDDEDELGDAEADLAMDMDAGMDDDADESDAEEALANVEDAIAELRAAFADIMGDAGSDEDDMDDEDMDDEDMDDEDMGDEDMDDEETVKPFGESADLKKVGVSMPNGEDKGAKSPVGKTGKGPTDAKPHPTDTKVENGGKAPAAKGMNVKGPQDHGAKMSSAPKAKKENTKATSESPLRGMK